MTDVDMTEVLDDELACLATAHLSQTSTPQPPPSQARWPEKAQKPRSVTVRKSFSAPGMSESRQTALDLPFGRMGLRQESTVSQPSRQRVKRSNTQSRPWRLESRAKTLKWRSPMQVRIQQIIGVCLWQMGQPWRAWLEKAGWQIWGRIGRDYQSIKPGDHVLKEAGAAEARARLWRYAVQLPRECLGSHMW